MKKTINWEQCPYYLGRIKIKKELTITEVITNDPFIPKGKYLGLNLNNQEYILFFEYTNEKGLNIEGLLNKLIGKKITNIKGYSYLMHPAKPVYINGSFQLTDKPYKQHP